MLLCLDMLRRAGAQTALLDCLHQTWSDIAWPKQRAHGHGPWPKAPLPAPSGLEHVPRRFSRYGLPYHAVSQALKRLNPPDAVLMTTSMTYWYPGAAAMARLIRQSWPRTPIILGGVYATLCQDHATALDVFDLVIAGPLERPDNWAALWNRLDTPVPPRPDPTRVTMALDSYRAPRFSIILGSRGCPFHCAYCASKALHPAFEQRTSAQVLAEARSELDRGVQDFAFYDDALLIQPETWLLPLLEEIVDASLPVRLHTPNALHVSQLSLEMCTLLKKAGLTTVRLGLETGDFKNRLDAKLSMEEWDAGLANLFQAGFTGSQLGAYILFGLPGQREEEVKQAIELAQASGVRPHLAQYSPIPGSPLFEQAMESSDYPLDADPIFQNNSIWPCVPGGFSWEADRFWKALLTPGID